jgi:hypothetical protein
VLRTERTYTIVIEEEEGGGYFRGRRLTYTRDKRSLISSDGGPLASDFPPHIVMVAVRTLIDQIDADDQNDADDVPTSTPYTTGSVVRAGSAWLRREKLHYRSPSALGPVLRPPGQR